MSILKKVLWVLAGALAALVGAKIVQDKAEEPQKWQEAWDNSSAPADNILDN